MKLKLDENGHVVVQDGKPVYVHEDGAEIAHDAVQVVGKIKALNAEAKTNRERAEKAEELAKGIEGLDVAAARKALDTVKNLDDKKLVDAGDVERLKAEWSKARDDDNAKSAAQVAELQKQLADEIVGGSFARTKILAETNMDSAMARALLGSHFSIKDGKMVATDMHGNQIMSRTNIGEPAGFDEAAKVLMEQHPSRETFMKPTGGNGGGAQGSGSGGTAPQAGDLGGSRDERMAAISQKYNLPAS